MLLLMQRGKAKMHCGACIIATHCVGHRSTLHPPSQRAASVNTRQNIGSTNAFTIFPHTLEKVREADYALFPTTQNREMLRSNSLSFSRY